MTDILIRFFVKNYKDNTNPQVRTAYGNFASTVGIVCNILLCAAKGAAGIIFNSVAILADAVNNLSDAGNSIISLVGFIAAGKPADKNHPYGHARIEYISCLIVSFLIVTLGFSMLKTSVVKIFSPEPITTGILPVAVLLVSICVKLWMGFFYRKVSKIISSDVIAANSTDSFNDVISTFAVLLTTVLSAFTDINLDSYAGIAVAFFIIFTGVKIILKTIDKLLGTVPDEKFIKKITGKILSYDKIMGIHDLAVHSYGPDKYFATVHAEVSAKEDLVKSHEIIDKIERDFLKELNINLVIHLDPVVVDDEKTNEAAATVRGILLKINRNLSMHDFRMVKGNNVSKLIFDVVVPPSLKISDSELVSKIAEMLHEADDSYYAVITVDRNYIS